MHRACTGCLTALPADVPAIDERGCDVIVEERADLFDHGQAYDASEPMIARHLTPQDDEGLDARRKRAVVHDIEAACSLVGGDIPIGQYVRVQIVKADRQIVGFGIIRVMGDLEIADGTVGIEEHSGSLMFFHEGEVTSAAGCAQLAGCRTLRLAGRVAKPIELHFNPFQSS